MASKDPLDVIELQDVDINQEFSNWMDETADKPLVIALAGRSGVGKSTLLNNILGLTGDMAAIVGHDGNATTISVTQHNRITVGKVTIDVLDTPGFDSLDLDESVILLDLEEKSKGKADLLLYCASLQPSGKIGITDRRIVNTLTQAFGKAIWSRTVLVLTFANEASQNMMKNGTMSYDKLLKNYASNFEKCLRQSSVRIKVLPPNVEIDESTNSAIRALPAGLDVAVPLPNEGDWMGVIQKEIVRKCNLDALPQLLLLRSGRVKAASVLQSLAGGAALGVVIGAGVGAGVGGALVGIPTLGVGAPLGIGVGSAAGALVGSLSSATIISVVHNRVVPALRKRAVIRKREKQYKLLESKNDLERVYYALPPELPIEEEKWFFGRLKRNLAEGKCKKNGDYLVRYSDKQNQYVLTCRWEGRGRHFPIPEIEDENDPDAPKQYQISSTRFPSIKQLLDYHVETKSPLTVKSQVTISQPIIKYGSIAFSNIDMGNKIGKGAFGDVYIATLISTNQKIAVKTCRSSEIQEREGFLQEAEILSKYDHPNVVRLLGLSEDLSRKHTYIVMEYMPGGSFLNFLKKKGFSQSKKKLCRMCIDACKGMKYLESMSCIHRDLAARNCLVGDNDILKISDFGMSREGGLYVMSSQTKLPLRWTAPEALVGKYTSASDVWSFGILLWEAFSCGMTPYPGMGNLQITTQIERGERMAIPVDCPQHVYGIMQQCWQHQPEERPDFTMLLDMLTQAEQTIIETTTNRMSTRL